MDSESMHPDRPPTSRLSLMRFRPLPAVALVLAGFTISSCASVSLVGTRVVDSPISDTNSRASVRRPGALVVQGAQLERDRLVAAVQRQVLCQEHETFKVSHQKVEEHRAKGAGIAIIGGLLTAGGGGALVATAGNSSDGTQSGLGGLGILFGLLWTLNGVLAATNAHDKPIGVPWTTSETRDVGSPTPCGQDMAGSGSLVFVTDDAARTEVGRVLSDPKIDLDLRTVGDKVCGENAQIGTSLRILYEPFDLGSNAPADLGSWNADACIRVATTRRALKEAESTLQHGRTPETLASAANALTRAAELLTQLSGNEPARVGLASELNRLQSVLKRLRRQNSEDVAEADKYQAATTPASPGANSDSGELRAGPPLNLGLQSGAPWPTSSGGEGYDMRARMIGPNHVSPTLETIFDLTRQQTPFLGGTDLVVTSSPVVSAEGRVYLVVANRRAATSALVAIELPRSSAGGSAGMRVDQVSGTIVQLTGESIVVARGNQRWELSRADQTRVLAGTVAVGSRVTIEYRTKISNQERATVLWSCPVPFSQAHSRLAIGRNGIVYVALDGDLVAVSTSGEALWRFHRPGEATTPRINVQGEVYESFNNKLFRIDVAGHGEELTSVDGSIENVVQTEGGRLAFSYRLDNDDRWVLFNPASRTMERTTRCRVCADQLYGDESGAPFVVSSPPGPGIVISADYGGERAIKDCDYPDSSFVRIGGGFEFVTKGSLVRYGRDEEALWSTPLGDNVSDIIVDDAGITYFSQETGNSGTIVAIDPQGRKRFEAHIPSAPPGWDGLSGIDTYNYPVPTLDGRLLEVTAFGLGVVVSNPPPPLLQVKADVVWESLAQDHALNELERIAIDVSIKNAGQGKAYGLEVSTTGLDDLGTVSVAGTPKKELAAGEEMHVTLQIEAAESLTADERTLKLDVKEQNGFNSPEVAVPLRIAPLGLPDIKLGSRIQIDDRPAVYRDLVNAGWKPGTGVSPGNGDGILQNGETVALLIPVRTSAGPVFNGRYHVAVASGDVLLGHEKASFGDLAARSGSALVLPAGIPEFSRAQTATFNMSLEDNHSGKNWGPTTVSVPIQLRRPELTFRYTLFDDNTHGSAGNGDGIPNPGETVALVVQVDNVGQQLARSATARVTAAGEGFMLNGAGGALGDVPVKGTSGEAAVLISPKGSTDVISLSLSISAEGLDPQTQVLNLPVRRADDLDLVAAWKAPESGAAAWVPLELGENIAASEIFASEGDTPWWAVSNGGLLSSADGGLTWQTVAVPAAVSGCVVQSPTQASVYVVPTSEGGLLKSSDGGAHWSRIEVPATLTGGVIRNVSWIGDNLLALADAGLLALEAGSTAWKKLSDARQINMMTVGAQNVWAALSPSGVFLGRGVGSPTLVPVPTGGPTFIQVAVIQGSVVAIDESGGVFRLEGSTWQSIGLLPGRARVRSLKAAGGRVLFASTDRAVLRSGDGGATWAPLGYLPEQGATPWSLVGDPARGNLFARSGNRIWRLGRVDQRQVLAGVLFEVDRDQLTPAAEVVLKKVAEDLKNRKSEHCLINGYTDNVGTIPHNLELSKRRADSVRNFLVGEGVPAGLLYSQGYGMDHPIASNEVAEGRAQNRRVEVLLIGQASVREGL